MHMHLAGRGSQGAMVVYEYGRHYQELKRPLRLYFIGDEVEVQMLV